MDNFEISLAVLLLNTTTSHAITYTNITIIIILIIMIIIVFGVDGSCYGRHRIAMKPKEMRSCPYEKRGPFPAEFWERYSWR